MALLVNKGEIVGPTTSEILVGPVPVLCVKLGVISAAEVGAVLNMLLVPALARFGD